MTSDGYAAFDDPYVYRGTNVLKNKAGIRDAETLEAFELEMTSMAAVEPIPGGRFDAAHLKAIHRHLFKDVYSWAGQIRKVRIQKGTNAFCYPEYISGELDRLLRPLNKGRALDNLAGDLFVEKATHILAELNAIHPFREGNGRTQLTFMALLSAHCSHPFDFAKIDRATYLPAVIESFDGNEEPLRQELLKLIRV